jgi:hypothetical protein
MPHGHLSVARGEPAVCRVVLLASELRRILPTFMCVVQARILDDAHEGRGWLENACR